MKDTGGQQGPVGAERYPDLEKKCTTLLVNEVYCSLQGEGPEQGYPIVIVRLSGCNLRCSYCDSTFAFFEGKRISTENLLKKIDSFGTRRVLITGGEPMVQAGTPVLCRSLLETRKLVSLETNGSFSLAGIPSDVRKVVDVKLPGSGFDYTFNLEILKDLGERDALKFVCSNREDYNFAVSFLKDNSTEIRAELYFMPVWKNLKPEELASWILEDKLEARMQVQLHKVLWGDKRGV